MISNIRLQLATVAIYSVGLAVPALTAGQSPANQARQHFETRTELEAQAQAAEAKNNKAATYLIRSRLEHGDFHDGDRIFLTVKGSAGFTDTLTVRSGRVLQLPQMADFPLEGVLRSELVPKLTAHLGKYLRDPQVQAIQLVRIGVLGNVVRPGFYYSPADIPLSDVLMTAGGPSSDADLGKVSVRREGDIIIDEENTHVALREGMSIDLLHIQAGDEISVGKQRNFNWGVAIPMVSGVLGLLLAVYQISR
jgi:protein involved in polysaccharide export with SLBB domain